jgi:hypothetical protein
MAYMTIKDQVAAENFSKKEDRIKYSNVYDAFINRGRLLDDKTGDIAKFELKDLVTKEDLMRFMPQTIETVVREAIEPNLFIVDRCFQSITIEQGSRIQIGALGAMEAGRVGSAGEYPERMMDLDGGDMVAITTDKYGIKISLTEEVVQQNQFDVVNVWLRAAGKAMARCKEKVGAKLINEMGYKIFDNADPSTSYCGSTTGRNIAGVGNGSMTVNDVFEMYAYLLNRGFSPDTLLLHPMAWKIFATDTEMREVVLSQATIAQVQGGQSAPGWPTGHNGFGLRTQATGGERLSGNTPKGPSAWTQTLNPLGATWNIKPSYLPSPIQVLVTPFVPFSYGSQGIERMDTGCSTNVIMLDSGACAVIGQGEAVRMDRWTDPERDIVNIKLRESWGMAPLEQGKAIAKASNIAIAKNYNFENSNSQTLSALTLSGVPSGFTAASPALP